jgi:hypothetical protein
MMFVDLDRNEGTISIMCDRPEEFQQIELFLTKMQRMNKADKRQQQF